MSSGNPSRPSSAALRASILPATQRSRPAATSAASAKSRHLSHLHSQLAQLSANLADLENLVRVTAIQAESIRGLGGWSGGLFMAASKVLGEETVAGHATEAEVEAEDDEHAT